MKWMDTLGVILDNKVTLKFKGKYYYTTKRPIMLYANWMGDKGPTRKQSQCCKMRILLRMTESGYTKQDRIANTIIRDKVLAALIVEMPVKSHLRWFTDQ